MGFMLTFSLLRSIASLVKTGRTPATWTLWSDPLVQEAARSTDAERNRGSLRSFVQAIARAELASAAAEIMRATYGAYVEGAWRRDRKQATGAEVPGLGYEERLAEYFDPQKVSIKLSRRVPEETTSGE